MISTAWSAYNGFHPPTEPLTTAAHTLAASGELYWNTAADPEAVARHMGPAAEVTRWIETGARLRDRTHLVTALRRLAGTGDEPMLELAARYALLAVDTGRLRDAAGWHAYYASAADQARQAARADLVRGVEQAIESWRTWRGDATRLLQAEFTGPGAAEVAAVKTHGPITELSHWLARLSG